jgi:hypothetical protein
MTSSEDAVGKDSRRAIFNFPPSIICFRCAIFSFPPHVGNWFYSGRTLIVVSFLGKSAVEIVIIVRQLIERPGDVRRLCAGGLAFVQQALPARGGGNRSVFFRGSAWADSPHSISFWNSNWCRLLFFVL